MLFAAWGIDPAFTACEKGSFWCVSAYWLTQSGGKYGTVIIVLVTSFLYTIRLESFRERIATFFRSVVALTIFLAAFAFINEHATKKLLRLPRPSHSYIIRQSEWNMNMDSLYILDVPERRSFLKQLIDSNNTKFDMIDHRVLAHWIEEAGYSFPSGHSFNAFLLAVILAFSIQHIRTYTQFRVLYFVPYVWAVMVAVSRVAMGAHSALDVTVGAGLGLLVAHIFIYFDVTRKLIIHKKLKS